MRLKRICIDCGVACSGKRCRTCHCTRLARRQISILDRLFEEALPTGACVEWPGARDPRGYGYTKNGWAHRESYIRAYGSIPEGLELDHLCRNPPCVNPAHLEAVTHAENMRRGARKKHFTHCKRGHEYNSENTRLNKDGHRVCRVCRRKSP